jgi:octaprenyl-diphosphate synthase
MPKRKTSMKKFVQAQLQRNPDLTELYVDIKKDLDQVEVQLQQFTKSPNKIIAEISEYLFKKSGKRIRPALLVLCAKMLGYKGKEHILMSALVETVHTASLIHDDIIDHSELRRGRKTVHARWGANITVLLGDYLYIKTLGLSLQSQHREVIEILTDVSAEMIDGELFEYYMSSNLDIREKDYLAIISKKTASLFEASCQIGGILGNASEEHERCMSEYGRNLGISFQIIDDLLDYTGEEKTLGKPVLADLSEGRITLPLIYTLNQDGSATRKQITQLMKKKDLDHSSKMKILEIVSSNGALDYAYEKAVEYAERSKEIISGFEDSSFRESLTLIPDYIISRKK